MNEKDPRQVNTGRSQYVMAKHENDSSTTEGSYTEEIIQTFKKGVCERIIQMKRVSTNDLSNVLKEYKEEHGYTSKVLAEYLGIPTMTLYRWEYKKVRISPVMQRLLEAKGVLKVKNEAVFAKIGVAVEKDKF